MLGTLIAKTNVQIFLFVDTIGLLLYAIAQRPPTQAVGRIPDFIFWLALAAIVVFALSIIVEAKHSKAVGAVAIREPRLDDDAWPTMHDVRIARGFMLLGVLIYIGYFFLDGFVISDASKVSDILRLRLVVSAIVLVFWLASLAFGEWFRRHYVMLITVATCIAGAGIGLIMLWADTEVPFYYQGFIQVIAFAAFAFRLPTRPLAIECALLLGIYAAIVGHQSWVPGTFHFVMERTQQAVVVNNLVSMFTFVALALATSATLGRER